MRKKKIWVGSEYYYPDKKASTSYFITKISEALGTVSDVSVFCATKNTKNGRSIRKEKINGVEINRLYSLNLNKNILILRSINFVFLGLSFLHFLFTKVKRGDDILIVTNPAPIIIIAAFIKWLKKCTLSIIVYDIFPENLLGSSIIKKKYFIYKILLGLFNQAYKKADTLISIGDDMSQVLYEKLKNYNGKVVKIPNWAETDTIVCLNKCDNSIIKEYGLNNKLVFGFAGNIGRAQAIPFLIEGIREINKADIHFIFFGGGAMVPFIKEAINKYSLNNITLAGQFTRDKQNLFLNACDVSIVSLNKGMFGLGVPSKTYNILASGRPILLIAEENTEISNLVTRNNIGWHIIPDEITDLKKTIMHIYNNRLEIIEKGSMAKELAFNEYNVERILYKYKVLFRS